MEEVDDWEESRRGLSGAEFFIYKMVTCIYSLGENSSSCTIMTCALLYMNVTLQIYYKELLGREIWRTGKEGKKGQRCDISQNQSVWLQAHALNHWS